MPKGGRRPGSGRKPKVSHLRALDGGVNRRPVSSIAQTPEPTAPIETFEPPSDLAPEAVAVWCRLAPLAFARRTLTRTTEFAFCLLCRQIVLEAMLSKIAAGAPEHRGVMQRVEAALLRFDLAPCGKPLYEPEPPKAKPKIGLARFLA